MLKRALFPQQRWDELGRAYQIDLGKAQFGDHLKALFLDSDRLDEALSILANKAAVSVEQTDNIESFICGCKQIQCMYGKERSYWIEQALWWFCYVCPRTLATLQVYRLVPSIQCTNP
jgi:hypothetical protein